MGPFADDLALIAKLQEGILKKGLKSIAKKKSWLAVKKRQHRVLGTM